nr:hypothetical protein [Tanacetum cinerariifolium]
PPSDAITTSPTVLSTEYPEDSLILGNEDLNTILEKELDEFIKSNAEDLVTIPSESEDTSGSDSECILPSYDDFSPIDVPEEKAVTFSNPIFNSNDDFISSDDESLSDEDVSKDNMKIYSNPLFEFDDEYISSDVNPLFDEVFENTEIKDSYNSNLDESNILVTPFSMLLMMSVSTREAMLMRLMILRTVTMTRRETYSILRVCLVMILPLISLLRIAPDLEASRARGFVHRPLELQSLAYGNSIS